MDVVKVLLENDANPDIPDYEENAPIHIAFKTINDKNVVNNVQIIKELIIKGTDPSIQDKNGNTPLHFAVKYDKQEIVELLLQYHANPDTSNNINSNAPLHYAVTFNDNINNVKLLLDNEADPDIQNGNGDTPLHIAVHQNKPEIIRFLIERNVKKNIPNDDNNTPLHFAVKYNKPEIAKSLIDNGVDISIENNEGQLPLYYAFSKNEFKNLIIKLLPEDVNDTINNIILYLYENNTNDFEQFYTDYIEPIINHYTEKTFKEKFKNNPFTMSYDNENIEKLREKLEIKRNPERLNYFRACLENNRNEKVSEYLEKCIDKDGNFKQHKDCDNLGCDLVIRKCYQKAFDPKTDFKNPTYDINTNTQEINKIVCDMGICKDENCELVKCKNSAICLDCLAACLVNDPDTRECLYCKKECDCDIAKALNSEEIKQRVNKIREQRSFGRRKLRRSRHKLRRSKKIRKFRTSIRKNNVPKIRRSRKK